MKWIQSQDDDYEERRSLFNSMIQKRPQVIAACASDDDVREALDRARRDGLEVAVRSGGHSVAGMSTNDDGLVIDVRAMSTVQVDPSTRRARAGGGATWGMFDQATQEHGLATTGGRISSTGVSGLTLNGGSGWLERRHGLACDNLVGVDLITADGRKIHADADHEPELLWACKGGGGNFGVVTALEFQLHPVGPLVYAGVVAWRAEASAEVARAFRDWAQDAPADLGPGLVFTDAPGEAPFPAHLQGRPMVGIAVLWAGDHDSGADLMKALRDRKPDLDLVGPMPYVEFQRIQDLPTGFRHYWSAEYLDAVPDAALDVLVHAGAHRQSALTQLALLPWGGELARIDPTSTPLSHRDAAWVTHPFGMWEDPGHDEANIVWVREYRASIAPYVSGGVYLNFIGHEGQDRVRAAYDADAFARLQAIKAAYDPTNTFRGNQNILPAAG